MRNGFTLIEVLVALVLFQFGMLALGAASLVAARELAVANLRTRAQTLARNRVELLRAAGCPAPGGGSQQAAAGMIEHWQVSAAGRLRIITDSVAFTRPRVGRTDLVLRAWTLCDA